MRIYVACRVLLLGACVLASTAFAAPPTATEYFRAAKEQAWARACLANMKVYSGGMEMYRLDNNAEPPGDDIESLARALVEKGYLQKEVLTCSSGEKPSYTVGVESDAPSMKAVECPVHGSLAHFRIAKLPFTLAEELELRNSDLMVKSMMATGMKETVHEKSSDRVCPMLTRSVESFIKELCKSGDCAFDANYSKTVQKLLDKGLITPDQQIHCPKDDAPFSVQLEREASGSLKSVKVTCPNHPSKP